MLTGQETITDLLKRFPQAQDTLYQFGLTREAEKHFRYKSLAHAALMHKVPLKKILDTLAAATGEAVAQPKVSGITQPAKPELRKGKIHGVKRVIAVHSGKGGVGKTFVAVHLALALARGGQKVGLLDADIDCPNALQMLELEGKLMADKDEKIVPLEKSGIKVVSMAPLLEKTDDVLLWRGPIVSRVVEQFVFDVAWGDLDVLVVDLPPGTSDVPLTLLNIVEGVEMLVVSTPQPLALMDAKKSIRMAEKMKIEVLGMVENMSGEQFGSGEVAKLAESLHLPFTVSIPLNRGFLEHDNPQLAELMNLLCKKLWNQ